MSLPLEIIFHNMDKSEAVESRIREKSEHLEKLGEGLSSCRVTIEAPHKSHRKGNIYQVRIQLDVPHGPIVVSHEPGDVHAHKNVYVAIRDAFHAAERQLKEHRQKLRGDVKTHEVPLHGRIDGLFPIEDHGFIKTNDGRAIYFHRNAIVNASFDDLEIGQTVELVIFTGNSTMGPHASTVKPISPMSYRAVA
jgi:cold shock CspA family protein/ribosome-associated translation inhibitor RaiA